MRLPHVRNVIRNRLNGTSEALDLHALIAIKIYISLLYKGNITRKAIVKSVIQKAGGAMCHLITPELNSVSPGHMQIWIAEPAILRKTAKEFHGKNSPVSQKIVQIVIWINISGSSKKMA
jgi:hypothetical protein